MLHRHRLLEHDGITIDEVACRHKAGYGEETESADGTALVLVRRGCFVRRVDGSRHLLDPTVAFCRTPGQEQRYDHPGDGGDDCTAIALDPAIAASLWGGDPELPAEPLPIHAGLDLEHRRLVAAARRGAHPDALYEQAIGLTAIALEQHDPRPVASGRPKTTRARRRLADNARQALAADAGRSLRALARDLAVSPHHLSRVFHAHTGHTISQHRLLLRARAALDRIAAGDPELARIAADLGFADQSHLGRTLRRQTGHTPTMLSRLLN